MQRVDPAAELGDRMLRLRDMPFATPYCNATDRGGTFTDCLGHIPNRPESEEPEDIVVKLLSHDPDNYKDAPREGVRRILEIVTGRKISREEKIDTSGIGA